MSTVALRVWILEAWWLIMATIRLGPWLASFRTAVLTLRSTGMRTEQASAQRKQAEEEDRDPNKSANVHASFCQ